MRYFTILLLLSAQIVYSQQSFELLLGDKSSFSNIKHSIEHEGSIYAAGYRGIARDTLFSFINKISLEGEILQTDWAPADMGTLLNFILPKENGNLLCIGTSYPTLSIYNYSCLYFREITPDLEMVWERYDSLPIPNNFTDLFLENFLIASANEIILQGIVDTAYYGTTSFPFFAKYDFDGNRLTHKIYYEFREDSEGSDLLFTQDSTAFFLMGSLSLPFYYTWAKFDLDFNYIECGTFPYNESLFTNFPLSVKRLADGNIIMSHLLRYVGSNTNPARGIELRKYSPDFQLLNNVLVHHDKRVYIPLKKGMDFFDEDHIWVATFEWEDDYNPTDLRFFVFDSELNLKGSKVFESDYFYWLYDLVATSDNGCIVSGNCFVPPHPTPYRFGYMQKVSLADVVTGIDNQMVVGQEVRIGPVPALDKLTVQTRSDSSELYLYSIDGQLLATHSLQSGVNLVDIHSFSAGIYVVRVKNNSNNTIESFKIIKQ